MCQLCKVKKAEGMAVGTRGCGYSASSRYAVASGWGVQWVCFSPNLGLAPCSCIHAHQHTHGHECRKQATPLVPDRSTDGAPLHQEWGTAEVSKGLLPKSLQQLTGAGARAKPTTCLLKEGLNYAVPPHLLPALSNIIPLGKPPPLHEIFPFF